MIERMDYDAVEAVEQQLDQFIEKRAREAKDAAVIEELWAEQERAHRERRREAHRQQWCDFHRHMERLHASLCEEHAQKAAALLETDEREAT